MTLIPSTKYEWDFTSLNIQEIHFNATLYREMSLDVNFILNFCLSNLIILTPSAAFTQKLSERPPKVVVKYGVYDGIERAVAVAEPEEHFEQGLRDEVGAAHGGERVREEEREPAENKHPHDHGQNKREAPLSGLPLLPAAHSLTRLHRRLSRLHLSNFGGPHVHLFHPGAEDVVVPIGRGPILLHF